MHQKRKTLNLTVKRRFQLWLLLRIFGAVLISSLVAACILYFYAGHEMAATFYDAHIKIRRLSDLLLPVVAAGSLVSLLGGTALALFLPQKIAGPLYRIEKGIQMLGRGDFTSFIKLRRGDILTELVDTLNDSSSALAPQLQEIKSCNQKLALLFSEAEMPEAQRLINIQRKALERFKLPGTTQGQPR